MLTSPHQPSGERQGESPVNEPSDLTIAPKPLIDQHISERETKPASTSCCKECPFKKENFNREHPSGQYTASGITRQWRNVAQDGGTFGCHLFDADALEYDDTIKALGYKAPADIGARRECTGMAAMIGRELNAALEYDNYPEYRAARPTGLSRKAFAAHYSRLMKKTKPHLRLSEHVKESEIADPSEIVDQASPEWLFSEAGAVAIHDLLQELQPEPEHCDCPVCVRHTEIHPGKSLRLAGGLTVEVDVELHPLLEAMAAAGIRTTGSCINLHEAVSAISPDALAFLMNGADRRTLNYETALRSQCAFIQLRNTSATERAFIRAISQSTGVKVETAGRQAQLTFHAADLNALTTALRKASRGKKPASTKAIRSAVPATSKQDLARKLAAKHKPGEPGQKKGK